MYIIIIRISYYNFFHKFLSNLPFCTGTSAYVHVTARVKLVFHGQFIIMAILYNYTHLRTLMHHFTTVGHINN